MAGVRSDPAQREQELEMMSQLRDVYNHGGLDLQSRAALNDAMNRASVQGNSARRALADSFAARGQLGSGAQLAMGNQTAQNQANASNQAALDAAASGDQRKMAALSAYGQAASQLRNQDFSEASARAKAQDEANLWNASAQEKANYYNNGGRQQQAFQDAMQRATGAVSAGNNLAGFYGTQQQMGLNMLGNAVQTATGAAGKAASGSGGGGGGQGYGSGGSVNPDDPNSVYQNGVNYGGSDAGDWANPYGYGGY
jgi:hypothetical protein